MDITSNAIVFFFFCGNNKLFYLLCSLFPSNILFSYFCSSLVADPLHRGLSVFCVISSKFRSPAFLLTIEWKMMTASVWPRPSSKQLIDKRMGQDVLRAVDHAITI